MYPTSPQGGPKARTGKEYLVNCDVLVERASVSSGAESFVFNV